MTLPSAIEQRLPLRIGTRASKLALAQAQQVKDRLAECYPELKQATTLVPIVTSGDRLADESLSALGGKLLFVKEIDVALLAGSIDLAVHSMKDVPAELPPGLEIACMTAREDPRDVMISPLATTLDQLAPQSRIGTSSLRRQAQILAHHPQLKVIPLRGNIQTRCRRLNQGVVDAIILAVAGLRRLNCQAGAILESWQMLPAPGQGALGVEIRQDDRILKEVLSVISCERTRGEVDAERALMAKLDGSCRMPIAALARADGSAGLSLEGAVWAPDGSWRVSTKRCASLSDGIRLGCEAGSELKSRVPSG